MFSIIFLMELLLYTVSKLTLFQFNHHVIIVYAFVI